MTRHLERIQIDVKDILRKCIAKAELKLYQYIAKVKYSSVRMLGAYPEQSIYSSANFLKSIGKKYARLDRKVERIQTDNGFEFTNLFSNGKRDLKTLFEQTAEKLGIHHKLITACKDVLFG